jgi:hypothetical protein
MDARDVALGLIVTGARAGRTSARLGLAPIRIAARAPVVGPPARRAAASLAFDGRAARERAVATAAELLERPELERAIDRALAGPLTDAVARSIGQNRVAERVASNVLAGVDIDRVVAAVLDDERTERALERALTSPGLERLVVRVLESRLIDDLTERVLESEEMDRVIGHVAASPEILEALSHHTETLTEEMVSDVRQRAQRVDELAERTVRGWLRRPRPRTT